MKRTLIALMLTISLLTFDVGCRHKTSTNPVVIKAVNANDAAHLVKTMSDAITAADGTLDAIKVQEADYYAKVKPWLVRLAQADDVAGNNVLDYQAGKIDFSKVAPAFQSISKIGLEIDPTIIGVKNPQNQQRIVEGFKLLQAAIASANQQFGTGQ